MTIQQLAPGELAAYLREHPNALLLDVRRPWEHSMAAISPSILIPLGSLGEQVEEVIEDKGRPVIVYCHHGIRSLQACVILQSLGYEDVLNLSGGIDRFSREVDHSIPTY